MTRQSIWTQEVIKKGIERFILENSRPPTARDFDNCQYLPSARQIQRTYGGLPALRSLLGLEQLDFTKGDLRREIALKGYNDGLTAEENLELLLVAHFGEPYVHTQKRYGVHTKNRYDFFVYCRGECFAVDVFTTGRAEYIGTNIRHKIAKYQELGTFAIYFVAAGTYDDLSIQKAIKSLPSLISSPNIKVVSEEQFLKEMYRKEPLRIPDHFTSSSTFVRETI